MPDRNSFKEEGLDLAHSLKGSQFTRWVQSELIAASPYAKDQVLERAPTGTRIQQNFQGPTSSDSSQVLCPKGFTPSQSITTSWGPCAQTWRTLRLSDDVVVCIVAADSWSVASKCVFAPSCHWLLHSVYSGFCLFFPGRFLGVYHHRISCMRSLQCHCPCCSS